MQTLLLQGLGLGFLGLLPAPVHDLDVVVEDGRDDGNQVSLDDSGADVLRSSDADIDDTLEGQVPFPHVHHILTPPLLQNAHQPLDAAIDRQDIPYAGGGGCEVSEVVQGVDEREGGGAVEGSAVIQGGGDADRGLVGGGNAEVGFTHCVRADVKIFWRMGSFFFLALVADIKSSKTCSLVDTFLKIEEGGCEEATSGEDKKTREQAAKKKMQKSEVGTINSKETKTVAA